MSYYQGGGQSWPPVQIRPSRVPPRVQAAPEAYAVYTTGNDGDEVVVKTLVGTYKESGTNHGRKVFRRDEHEGLEVFLYYWDNRDGAEHEGWWFGNQLGGTQVWSHNKSSSTSPPAQGWRIPWNGPPRNTLTVANAAETLKLRLQESFEEIQLVVREAEMGSMAALEQARLAAGGYDWHDGLKSAETILQPQVASLSEALKQLRERQRGASGDMLRNFTQLGNALWQAQTAVNTELKKVQGHMTRAQQGERQRLSEEKDRSALRELLQSTTVKAQAAEDAVEKVAIFAETVAAAGDDLEEAKAAVAQTEQASQEAQRALGEARAFLGAKQAVARRFESEAVRQEAMKELQRLAGLVSTAMARLKPLQDVRKDYTQRLSAEKIKAEVLARLSPAELEVDRAEEATAVLQSESASREAATEAERCVAAASEQVAGVISFLESKIKGAAAGVAREELEKLLKRAREAEGRAAVLRNRQKEAMESGTCRTVLTEGAAKLKAVQEALAKVEEAEGPFMLGLEELPLEETTAAVKACETAVAGANTAVSVARMFLATKLVEAKRFSEKHGREATAQLKSLQGELEKETKKLGEMKKANMKRRKDMAMREAEAEVSRAEGLAVKACGCSAFFEEKKLAELSSDEIRTAAEEATKSEEAATAALTEARKYLTQKQIEAKGKEASVEVGSELIKLQTRLTAAGARLAKAKKLSAGVEQKLSAKRSLEEAQVRLNAAEEAVARLAEVAKAQDAEEAAAEAQQAVKAVTRYIDMQLRINSPAKEELEKIQEAVAGVQERLEGYLVEVRETAEKRAVEAIVSEAEEKTSCAEEALATLRQLEEDFASLGDEFPAGETGASLEKLSEALTAAQSTAKSARRVLAVKKLAAKRLVAAESTAEKLAAMQERLESKADIILEVKDAMLSRRRAGVRREASEALSTLEEKVSKAAAATKALAESASAETAATAMKAACQKAGSTQAAAFAALESGRTTLLNRQRDAKTCVRDETLLEEVNQMVLRLTALQTDLEKQRTLLRDQEHRFVAQRLGKDAEELLVSLEKKLETAETLVGPCVSSEGVSAAVAMAQLAEALHARAAKQEKPLADVCREALENKFEGFDIAPEHLESLVSGAEDIREAVEKRFLCTAVVSMTDGLEVKTAKTLRKVELDEVLRGVSEPEKDESSGLLRVKCKGEKDETEGHVTIAGNGGTVYLTPFLPQAMSMKRSERALSELAEAIKAAGKYLEQKVEELKTVRTGPLWETKGELLSLRPRLSRVMYHHALLRKRLGEAEAKMKELREEEEKKQLEEKEKQGAEATLATFEGKVEAGAVEVEAAVTLSEGLLQEGSGDAGAMVEASRALDAAVATLEAVHEEISKQLETWKAMSRKGPFGDARNALGKLRVRANTLEAAGRKQIDLLKDAKRKVVRSAQEKVKGAVRTYFAQAGMTASALFHELSEDEKIVTASSLRAFVEKIPHEGLESGQLDLALESCANGLTWLAFLEQLQEFYLVVKEIAMTTELSIKGSKTVRKLLLDEYVEVLSPPEEEATCKLSRVRCRAVSDNAEGYVTVKGNAGSQFLSAAHKPYFCCGEEWPLHADFASSSPSTKTLPAGEVLEVLEGPRKESSAELTRLKCKLKDGATGTATLRDADSVFFEKTDVLVCKKTIAITSSFDLVESKALRKLDIGELLERVGEDQSDVARGLVRLQVKCRSDGKEGWITKTGNQGTTFVQEAENFFVCLAATDVEGARQVEVGEVIEGLEAPTVEVREGATRVKCRSIADGSEGWLTAKRGSAEVWCAVYKVLRATAITESADEAKVVRRLLEGEALEALAGPAPEDLEGAEKATLRVKVRARRDGAIGFVTLHSPSGTRFLKPWLLCR